MVVTEGVLLGMMAMVIIGTADFFAKLLVPKIGVRNAVMTTELGGGLFLLPFMLAGGLPALSVQQAAMVLLASATGMLGFLFFYKGLSVGKVSVVSPIAASYPAIVVLAGLLWLGEQLSAGQAIAVSLLIMGTVLVSANLAELKRVKFAHGVPFALLAMLSWGVAIVVLKPLAEQLGAIVTVALTRLLAGGALLFYATGIKKRLRIPRSAWMLALTVAVLDTLGFASGVAGLAVGLMALVAPIAAAFPFVTVILAGFFLRERLEGTQYAGIGMVLAGLMLLTAASF